MLVEILVPIGVVFLGVIGLTIYVLVIALRDAIRRISDINEQLLIMAAAKDGNGEAARALVASRKIYPLPVKKPESKKEPPQGKSPQNRIKLTLGGGM